MIGLLLILHVYLWGWGLTLLILPHRWRRFWPVFCAPVGLALQSAVVWIGTHTALAGTDQYARASLALPAGLLAVVVARNPRGAWLHFVNLRRWWALGLVMAISLTLQTYPFTRPPRVLTSIAMTSCDAADYAAGARVFKEFAHGDRTGFLGVPEPVAQLGVDNFYDFWLRINHFSPSALIALNASVFNRQPYELTTLMGVILLTLHLPGVFWLARSAFRFRPLGSLAVTLLYAVGPGVLYAMYQVALGQLMAAPAVALLTWTGWQAFRGPGSLRRYAGYSGLMLTGNWLLLGGYNFFLAFAYVPLVAAAGMTTLIWGRWARAMRWAGFIGANLAVSALLAAERVVTLARRFFLFNKTPFGWPIPGFYPSGWYGAFADIYLHPMNGWWPSVVSGACLVALVATVTRQGRRINVLAASCTLPILFGYWLLLHEDARLHDNASYNAYKLFTVFYPGILVSLCLWIRAAGRMGIAFGAAATLLWAFTLAINFSSDLSFNTYIRQKALRVTAPLSSLVELEKLPAVQSVNLRQKNDWDRLWSNCFLLRKLQFFSQPTYEGRPLEGSRGRWNIDERSHLVSAHFAGEIDPLRSNAQFVARDRQDPRFLDVRLDAGWYPIENTGAQYWCWGGGHAQFVIVNPHQGSMDCTVTFSMRCIHTRTLRLCAGPRCWWEGRIGTEVETIRDVPLPVASGTTVWRFESPEPADRVAGDIRPLAFALSALMIEVPVDMPSIEPHAYRIMREVEDAHWWFDGMEHITQRLLEPIIGQEGQILDAGCGTGRNLCFLKRYGQVTGLDVSIRALDYCRERGFERLVCGSVNALPFADGTFDLVTSFDVFTSHGVDDAVALRETSRVLRRRGYFFVRVAAYDWLRSRHDLEWAITHRYHRAELRGKLASAGFEVIKASYANTWLLPLALLKRWSERWVRPRSRESDLQLGARPSVGARLLRMTFASEARWIAGRGLPFGLSLIALATKR